MSHHFIDQKEAAELIHRYRHKRRAILGPEIAHEDILPDCETFDRHAIEKLLAVPGCEKIRIYYGMADDLKVKSVIVAANKENSDILPEACEDAVIVERSFRCPDLCPPHSELTLNNGMV